MSEKLRGVRVPTVCEYIGARVRFGSVVRSKLVQRPALFRVRTLLEPLMGLRQQLHASRFNQVVINPSGRSGGNGREVRTLQPPFGN